MPDNTLPQASEPQRFDPNGVAELTVSQAWHAGYSSGYCDAERDVAEYLDDVRYRMSRCEHRSSETRAILGVNRTAL